MVRYDNGSLHSREIPPNRSPSAMDGAKLRDNLDLHRIAASVFPNFNSIELSTMLWYLIVGALIIPDLIDTTAQLARSRRISR